MAVSVPFYVEGLGFRMTKQWTPDGQLRWCWLEMDGAALMLQDRWRECGGEAWKPSGKVGEGVTICFNCMPSSGNDALSIYHDLRSRGIAATRPFVGNGMWVTSVSDPDGYRLEFQSPTDVAEETVYEE